MFKIKTLNLIQKYLTENENSIIHENDIDVEFQTDAQLLVKTKRIEDVEHDLFAFLRNNCNQDTESEMVCSTMIESIRFDSVFNGILIYIAE